jgi:hypothetical protein
MRTFRCPLVYICDSLDGRDRCRSALFSQWHKEGTNYVEYNLESRVLEFTDLVLVVGIVSFRDDSNFESYFDQIDSGGFGG